jgi:TolA-binding protein
MEDYVEAEAWGHQAIAALGDRSADDREATDFLGQIWNLDTAVARSVTRARDQATGAPDASGVLRDAVGICDAGMMLDLAGLGADAIGSGMQQLYVRVKKRHTAQVLAAEYANVSERSTERRAKRHAANAEPLLFAALVLSGDSFDSIKERLFSLVTDASETSDWLYRFAMFAQRVKQLDLATSALDAGTSENASAAHLEALEGIAEMYLEASNHLKAIDIYRKVAAKSKDLSKGRAVLIKIIDIYAEDVKNYEEAIRECEAFIARYPDSSQTSYVEFYIGKLAYLNRDYAGAAGQLDGFQKRYREHPQVGQAMLLAGLSRMAEGNTQEAIGRFSQVIRRYPDGDLAPRSKFLIGYAQLSEQKYDASLETFGQLIEQFPESQYVAQAQSLIERLQRISR